MLVYFLIKCPQNCVQNLLLDRWAQKCIDSLISFIDETYFLILCVVSQGFNAGAKEAFRNVFISKCRAEMLEKKIIVSVLAQPNFGLLWIVKAGIPF